MALKLTKRTVTRLMPRLLANQYKNEYYHWQWHNITTFAILIAVGALTQAV